MEIAHYTSDVVGYFNYSTFGSLMPGRHPSVDGQVGNSDTYRYGFSEMESDDEVKGTKNSYTTEFRQLDPRIGRWLSLAPVFQPLHSPYSSMNNNPIRYNDVKGLKGTDWIKREGLKNLLNTTNSNRVFNSVLSNSLYSLPSNGINKAYEKYEKTH